MGEDFVHPYIPNSVPEIKREMLDFIGVSSANELYAEMIPERLLFDREMELPDSILSELKLKRHVVEILSRNKDSEAYISFLGAGCWQHNIPKVCEVIQSRSEFLTAYAGGTYSDLGRYQANFEFQSLICELLGMEVSGLPTYDWGAAAGNSIRMASRLSGRKEVLVPRNISPSRLKIIRNFCGSVDPSGGIKVSIIDYDLETGRVDLNDLESKLNEKVAGVYFENPNYLGVIETEGEKISNLAHMVGAESIVGVDPISLGVIAAPSEYGADIACGEAQSLGVSMYAGGGSCGFIASRDEEKYVAEYPLRILSIAPTKVEGEYGFGQALYHRTSYLARENAKDWIGTSTVLWGITAAVYMSLMGPQGMKEVGETILEKSHYTAGVLDEINGVEVPYYEFFKEFPVKFSKPVISVNKRLLKHHIIGGYDLSENFPELGESALYCITEMHNLEMIEKLENVLQELFP
jgi:glycine dehydrogenase subunit 1